LVASDAACQATAGDFVTFAVSAQLEVSLTELKQTDFMLNQLLA